MRQALQVLGCDEGFPREDSVAAGEHAPAVFPRQTDVFESVEPAGHVEDAELRESRPKVFGRGKRVGAHKMAANARVLFLKALYGFGDDPDGRRFGGGNPDVARKSLRRHCLKLRSVDESEDVLCAAEKEVPFFREFEAARGALEKFLSEFFFEVCNLTRERRLRDGELLRGGGEALFPGDFDERTKYLEIHDVAWATVRVATSPPDNGRHRHHSATTTTSGYAERRRSFAWNAK